MAPCRAEMAAAGLRDATRCDATRPRQALGPRAQNWPRGPRGGVFAGAEKRAFGSKRFENARSRFLNYFKLFKLC